jgi:hypothetical protein
MNPPSLHALIIDQQLGELPPEVAELLETHLAQNAEARAEAERIRQTLTVTQQAMLLHPELARVGMGDPAPRGISAPWLAKAAAIALLGALAGAGGFFAGRKPEAVSVTTITSAPPAPRKDSPWARYRIAQGPGGVGLQAVRVDTSNAASR